MTDVSMLGVRESDGVSVYRPPGEARYCTADMLDVEEFVVRSGKRRLPQAVTDDTAQEVTKRGGLTATEQDLAVLCDTDLDVLDRGADRVRSYGSVLLDAQEDRAFGHPVELL